MYRKEGGHATLRNEQSLGFRKDKKIDSFLEPPERNTVLVYTHLFWPIKPLSDFWPLEL